MNEIGFKMFFATLRDALARRTWQIKKKKNGRFPKRQLFIAFNKCKGVFADVFGVDTESCKSRWSVGPNTKNSSKSANVPNTKIQDGIRIIEYLVDYCISNVAIPQAIDQTKAGLSRLRPGQLYGMLLAVESEMGDDDEVARDFLKLMDVKSPVKCLVFCQRSERLLSRLIARIEWVAAHHLCYNSREKILLLSLPSAGRFDIQNVRFWNLCKGKATHLEMD